MRRSHLTALAAVSLAVLMSATSTQAVTPTINLGLLKPQDQWKVGTVDADGASYCAMVNKFDKQVVLAFARSPEGFGSVAMDFRERFFEPGAEYEVSLKVDNGKTRNLVGRASSDRSVVVQIGQDGKFFESLNANGSLEIGMPTIDVAFALRKFSGSYKNLIKCSDQLEGGSAKVEQSDLAPIDREVKKLAEERTQIASAEREVEQLQDKLEEKTSGFDDIEEQLEEEAKAEQEKTETRIEKLDDRKEDLTEKLTEEKEEAAELAKHKEKVERKLLAGMGKNTTTATGETSGLTAQQLEKQQVAVSEYLKAEQEAKKTAWMKEQVAALETQKAREAEAHVAAFNKQEKELAEKSLKLQKQRDQLAAENTKGAKAGLIAKQAQIAEVETQRAEQSQELTRKLASTQTDFQSRIAALEAERDELKQKLAAVQFDKVVEPAAGGEDLAGKLAASEKEKRGLADRLAKLEKQNSLLEATIHTKAEKGDKKENSALQAELVDLKASHTATLASLQKQLNERAAQYDELRKQFDAQQAQLALHDADVASADNKLTEKHGKIIAQLAEKQSTIARLESQLKEIETQRAAEAGRAEKAQADLETARKQIAELRQGLGGDQQRLASLQDSLESQKVELQKKAGEQLAEAKRLELERVELSALRDQLNSGAQSADGAREKLAGISSGKSYDDAEVRTLQKELEQKQADLERQALAQNQQADWLEREKAAVARAKSGLPAESLMASERAELEEARIRIKQLEQQAAQSQGRVAAIDSSYQQGRAVETAGNAAAFGALEKRAAELDAREQQLAAERSALDAAKGGVGTDGALKEAQAEIDRLKSENAKLAGKLYIKASAEAESTAEMLSKTEPAAGGATAQDASKKSWFGAVGYNKHTQPEPERVAEAAPVIDTSVNFAVPAVPSTPVAAERMALSGGSDGGNRAAAFLDRIMAYHRPDGAQARTLENEQEFAVAEEPANEEPVLAEETVTQHVAIDTRRPVVPDSKQIDPKQIEMAKAEILSTLSPAAGSADTALTRPSFVPAEPVSTQFAPTVEKVSAVTAPTLPAVAAQSETVETILARSGIRGVSFTEADAGITQWTTGNINGMYEQVASSGGGFDAEVQDYLGRYREDCPGNLSVSVGPAEAGPSGTVAVADIACGIPSNTYTSSIVFVENAGGFAALLHTGYPQDAAKVKSYSDNIAYTLSSVGGIASSPAPVARKAEVEAPASQPLKFRIAIDAPAKETPVGDDYETVVVQ